ncbi:MAG: hypothetical protein IJ222_01190 [Bacteroidales bacterium]|nr:hypothetical protein [Bacteroidales bacterium]
MTAKTFLETQVVSSISSLIENDPFVAFTIMAISIEFLGKGQNVKEEWGKEKESSQESFKKGMVLFPDEYKSYQQEYDLFHSLRCGFAHCVIQSSNIVLHRKGVHYIKDSKLHLSCEQFFADYQTAVNKLIGAPEYSSKMEKDFFTIDTDEQGFPSSAFTADIQTKTI